ncbi:MAG: HAD-IB family phosphatase [Candidatus Eremiobacteraeota bacterium]|nr:HAD-IB family phosphatase [Candidatus Eremiobacteraeota bacterium]
MTPAVVFVDYDGTITDADTFDVFVRHFAGDDGWNEIERRLAAGDITLREALALEASLVTAASLDEADDVLQRTVRFDPTFARFVERCEARGMRLTIVSSGIEPLIRRALEREGLSRVPLLANPVTVSADGWRMDFRDASDNGNDKAALVRAARSSGASTIYIGDGYSDFDAALTADRRFAKRGRMLERFLRERSVTFQAFSNFAEVIAALDAAA